MQVVYPILALGALVHFSLAQEVDPYADPANDPSNPQKYIPNDTYAYTGFGVYLAIVVACLVWSIRYPARYMIVLTVSCALYATGLFLRTEFAKDPHSIARFLVMRLLTILPAGGFFVLVYILLSQVAHHLDAVHLLPLKPTVILILFVTVDIIGLALQATGTSMLPFGSQSNRDMGKTLLLIGFIIQIVSVVTFSMILGLFVYCIKKARPEEWKARPYGRFRHYSIFLYCLGFACQNLFIRTGYRVMETAQWPNGKLARSETWFYMLDALQLVNVVLGFVVLWPPFYLRDEMKIRTAGLSSIELSQSPSGSKLPSPPHTLREV